MKRQETYGFIGLGLIGGSIARALRQNVPAARIIAYDINRDTLRSALEEGIADETADRIDGRFSVCDYLFLCAPVQKNDANLDTVKRILSPDCTLTDVGSVKSDIHRHIEAAGLTAQFIGGHPMAGSERTGYLNSKSALLENAYYILTPTPDTPPERTERYRTLVRRLGAIPLILTCAQHDYVTAAISHLPHVIAASLVNLIKDSDSEEGIMRLVAAGGFKDITRIASSSPAMWQQICLTNTENISKLLGDYIAALSGIKENLDAQSKDALFDLFDTARSYRDSFTDAPSGPIKPVYTLRVDIADEPGALASIATMLALHQISIKNIGITHNREFEAGVLRIEFHEESAVKTAGRLLTGKGYTVHS